MTEDRFLMWRACFAILHLDGVVTEEEENWAENVLFDQPFSEEQKEQLRADLKNQNNFDELFDKLQQPQQKAWILHMVRTLGNIDSDYDEKERTAFKRVEDKIVSNLDIRAIKKDIQEMEDRSYHKSERRKYDENLPELYKGFKSLGDAVDSFISWLKK